MGYIIFSRYKSLLHLCDESIELADRHGLDEGRLRHLLGLSSDDQTEMVRQIIHLNLSAKQIVDLIQNPQSGGENPVTDLPRQARQLVKLMRPSNEWNAFDLAQALVEQEGEAGIARIRLQHLRNLLDETETYLNAQ